MNGRTFFIKYKRELAIVQKLINLIPKSIAEYLMVFFRYLSGRKGLLIRYFLFKVSSPLSGSNISIHESVFLFSCSSCKLGNDVSIHPLCYIDGTGGVVIGDNVSIAHNSTIMSTEHGFSDPFIPIKYQEVTRSKTTIGSNVWIGAGVKVLAGASIPDGCVIAAGSVVKGRLNLQDTIYAGVPAVPKKGRFDEDCIRP